MPFKCEVCGKISNDSTQNSWIHVSEKHGAKILKFENIKLIAVRNTFLIGRGSPEKNQYDRLRWTWLFNRNFLEKFRPGRLIEQDAYIIETLE